MNRLERISRDLATGVPASVATIMDRLGKKGFEAYIVGGCVRDAMLGRTPDDWDVTTNATPAQMKGAVGLPSRDTGLKHGTVTFIVDGETIETTTFRTESGYSDSRHPDSIGFASTLVEDLSRRDFTVNAMAWSPETGIVDPFDGVADLERHVLRCVGDANERFAEDGLRVMRALRLASVHGLDIEEETACAMHAKRMTLDAVSRERISVELAKMMAAPDGRHLGDIVRQFPDIMFQVAPELEATYGFAQDNPHHDRDCWTHMVDVMAGTDADPELRLAALLHDIGKPACKTMDDEGIAHYPDHATTGSRMAGTLLRRLKFPRKTVDEVTFLIRQHDSWPAPTLRSARRFLARCGDETTARKLLRLMRADRLAHAPGSIYGQLDDLDRFEPLMEAALQDRMAFKVADLEIGGNDLIALGWEPGPGLGAELERLFDLVLSGDLPNERASLLAAVSQKQDGHAGRS